MTEFKIEPIQQMVIHDLLQEDLDNFLHQCYLIGVISVIWVDGIVIDLAPLTSKYIAAEQSVKNIKYFERITFVKYPKFIKSLKWNGGNYELSLRNYMNVPRFRELAKWIKSQPVWKKIPEKMA